MIKSPTNFSNWYETYGDKFISPSKITSPRYYENQCIVTHCLLFHKFGRTTNRFTISIDDIDCVDFQTQKKKKIIELLDSYWLRIWNADVDKNCLVNPYMRYKKFDKLKTTKYLSMHVRKTHNNINYIKAGLETVNKIGKLHSQKSPQISEYFVYVLFAPDHFLQLGHYGADKNSCYSKIGCESHRKILVAHRSNEFIVLVRTYQGRKNLIRAIGEYSIGTRPIYFDHAHIFGDGIDSVTTDVILNKLKIQMSNTQ